MYKKPRVDVSIDCGAYEHMINNVRFKAPLEIGVEIAVFMLLFGLLEESEFEVVDVNTMRKTYAEGYADPKDGGIPFGAVPDLVIVEKDFVYDNQPNDNRPNDNHAVGFVEVKSIATNDMKLDTGEMESHKANTNHLIWTNGLKWYYFNRVSQEAMEKPAWSVDLAVDKKGDNGRIRNLASDKKGDNGRIRIDERKYGELLYRLNQINWKQNDGEAVRLDP